MKPQDARQARAAVTSATTVHSHEGREGRLFHVRLSDFKSTKFRCKPMVCFPTAAFSPWPRRPRETADARRCTQIGGRSVRGFERSDVRSFLGTRGPSNAPTSESPNLRTPSLSTLASIGGSSRFQWRAFLPWPWKGWFPKRTQGAVYSRDPDPHTPLSLCGLRDLRGCSLFSIGILGALVGGRSRLPTVTGRATGSPAGIAGRDRRLESAPTGKRGGPNDCRPGYPPGGRVPAPGGCGSYGEEQGMPIGESGAQATVPLPQI